MEAKDHLINDVLREGRRYMVPLYQRQYQWGSRRLGPFWEDVSAKADSILEGSARFQHYMGALILAPGGDGYAIGVTPRVQVVDGQQRLTTFQLMLAAIREVARDIGAEPIVRQVSDYVFNQTKSSDKDPTAKFKLSPTPADRDLFHDIIEADHAAITDKYRQYYFNNGKLRKGGAPAALLAYEFFIESVEAYARFGSADSEEQGAAQDATNDPETKAARVEALLQALLSGMKLVVITLDEGDDAQVIFETLNSQGQPLLAMDLVRNNIFHRAEAQGETAERLYAELWESFDAQWWRELSPRAKPKLPRIDHFLAHVLTSQTAQQTSMREIYAEYRAYARPKGKPRFPRVEDELRILTSFAPTYEVLEGRTSSKSILSWLGRKLAAWEMTTAYPVVLLAERPGVSDEDRESIARMIYAYIVRRGVCGLSTKSIYAVFHRVVAAFREGGTTAAVMAERLVAEKRDAYRFPDDKEFVYAIKNRPLYGQLGPGRLADILWELELATRTAFAERLDPPAELSIEHVLPQAWGLGWPTLSGRGLTWESADEEAEERNRALHRLSNLTLITGVLNSALSNGSFETKRSKLNEHSLLALNKEIVGYDKWDEGSMAQRGERLSELALTVWPYPIVSG